MTRLHKTMRNRLEKAIRDYGMIEKGDRILVGVSGGLDSLTLLKFLHDRMIFNNLSYSLLVAHLDLGFNEPEPMGWKLLETHFRTLGVDYRIIHTRISQDALSPDAKKNPCFICSLSRRRKVYELAHREKCNKIAYGHHKDDIVETLLINILYGRKIETMNPIQEVFKGKMHIIRPLAYIEEALIKKFALEAELPQISRFCPMDGLSRRQRVKDIIIDLQKSEKNANIRENIFRSLSHVNIAFRPSDIESGKTSAPNGHNNK